MANHKSNILGSRMLTIAPNIWISKAIRGTHNAWNIKNNSVVTMPFIIKKLYVTPANICGLVRAVNSGSRSSESML